MALQVIDETATTDSNPASVYQLLADGSTWPDWSPIDAFTLLEPGSGDTRGPGRGPAVHHGAPPEPGAGGGVPAGRSVLLRPGTGTAPAGLQGGHHAHARRQRHQDQLAVDLPAQGARHGLALSPRTGQVHQADRGGTGHRGGRGASFLVQVVAVAGGVPGRHVDRVDGVPGPSPVSRRRDRWSPRAPLTRQFLDEWSGPAIAVVPTVMAASVPTAVSSARCDGRRPPAPAERADPHARHGRRATEQQLGHRLRVPYRTVPPAPGGAPHRSGLRDRLQRHPDRAVPAAQGSGRGHHRRGGRRDARAGRSEGPAHRLRRPLDPRRAPATAIGHALGAPVECDPTLGRCVAAVGPARGQFGREHLVQPSDPGGFVSGLDPARSRPLAPRGPTGPLVTVGWGGQRRLGPGGVDLRRGVRGHLCPRGDVAVRHAGGGAVLLRRRAPGGAARASLHDPARRALHPDAGGSVPGRHGGAPGVAGAGILAGPRWHPAVHGRRDVADVAARLPLVVGGIVRLL